MTRFSCSTVGSVACVMLLAASARAQQQNNSLTEFGVDGMLAHRTTHTHLLQGSPQGGAREDVSSTVVAFPVQSVRLGLYMSDNVQLEPAVGVTHSATDGGSVTQVTFDIALPIYLTGHRGTDQVYVRPVVGLAHVSTDFNDFSQSGTQTTFGAGVGLKLPIDTRITSRLEAQYRHANHTDLIDGYDQIALAVGIGVYTR